MRINLNNDWYFSFNLSKEKYDKEHINYLDFDKVRIPHNIKNLPLNYFNEEEYQSISLYVKEIDIDESFKDKDLILTFLGVAHVSKVYINNILVKTYNCGYTSFKVNIRDYIKINEKNLIIVEVDSRETNNVPPFGNVIDYLTYGGIYREVYLDVLNEVHFENVHIDTSMDKSLRLNLKLSKSEPSLKLDLTLRNKRDGEVFKKMNLNFEEELYFSNLNVLLWDVINPHLYELNLTLKKKGEILDIFKFNVGFRTFSTKNDGFYLNGEKVKIRGLNRHQAYPYVGYAMPKRVQELDAYILKNELFLNAVRTSHYPQSHDFINKCDELGLLVFIEAPGWQYIGDESWIDQALININDMMNEYYNHPSIFLYGVRINESQDNDEFYKKANEIAKSIKPNALTGGVRNFKKSHLFEDIYTYNDFIHNGQNLGCEAKKKVTSDINKCYLISEYNGHMFPTKSFDDEIHRLEHALRHLNVLNSVNKNEDIAGSFGRCFADYNTHKDFGAGDHICYHGVYDIFRNPKLASSVYSSQQDDVPILEVSSSFDIGEHPAGYLGDVYIFSNCDKIKFYKNNELLKTFYSKNGTFLKHPPFIIDDIIGDLLEKKEVLKHRVAEEIKEVLFAISKYGQSGLPFKYKMKVVKLLLSGKFKYEDGVRLYGEYIQSWGNKTTTYKFVGVKNEKEVIEVIKSPSLEVHYDFNIDTTHLIEENTYDVATLRILAKDQNNNTLPYISRVLEFKIEGDIKLLSPSKVALVGGSIACYIASNKNKGKGLLKVYENDILIKTFNFKIG